MKNTLVTACSISLLFLSSTITAQQNIQSLLNRITMPAASANYVEANPATTSAPHLEQFFQFQQQVKSFHPDIHADNHIKQMQSYPDTLIVGVPPYDTLTITGNFTHTGPIFVALKGLLIIKNATVTNLGDVDVFNNGKVIVDSSTLSFPQQYFYQRALVVVGKGNVSISNTTLEYGGMSHNCEVADTGTLSLYHVTEPDWMTAGINNHGTISINGTNQAGEFILSDYITMNVKNATHVLLWHQFPDTAVINWSFGKRDTAYGYQFNNSQPGVRGIEYHVTADSVYNVMWAMMPSASSNVTITNSKIRSIGLWFDHPADSVQVSGITDNAVYSNYTAPLSDRTFNLTNCTVQTWSFYVFHKSIINVTGCIAGEIGTENASKMYGSNYVVDGSGGYHWTADTSFIVSSSATVYSYVRSEGTGIFVFAYGNVGNGGGEEAINNALLIVVQSLLPSDPTAVNGGAAEFDNINSPSNLFVDTIIPVDGSAWIHRGPTSNWMHFKNWQLFYRSADSNNLIPITTIDTNPVSNNLLGNWNTHSLTAGNYILDLRVTDSWGNKLDAQREVTLLPLILGVNSLSSLHDMNIYPNPASDELNVDVQSSLIEGATITLYNILGQPLLTGTYSLAAGDNLIHVNISGLCSGTYLCRIYTNSGSLQKVVEITK